MAIRTKYEISKPDQQFYSVERVGYTSVGEAAYSIVDDMLKLGAFITANVNYKAQSGKTVAGSWPIGEVTSTITETGVAFKTGDQLQMVGGDLKPDGTPFQITVGNVSQTGTILTYIINNTGNYLQVPGPSNNVPMEYVDGSFSHDELTINGNIVDSIGETVTYISPQTYNYTNSDWQTKFGVDGSGGTEGSRWPSDGIWFFKKTTAGWTPPQIGANVWLSEPGSLGANSTIPTDTYITSVKTIKVIANTTRPGYPYRPVTETLSDAYEIKLNNSITISRGDKIKYRGRGATFDNRSIKVPNQWTVIMEATGAVDPLNDNIGVYGNVAVSTSNSNQVQITNVKNTNIYNPVIYPGQIITAVTGDSTPVNLSVVEVTNNYEIINDVKVFKANITLSSNVSFESDKGLHFTFEPQPWRVAFQVLENSNSKLKSEILNVYAATPLQLPNSGVISKVFDENGNHVDWAGLLGDKWANGAITPSITDVSQGFYNRQRRVSTSPELYPLNYTLTITNRGVFVGMWEGNWTTMQKTTKNIGTDNYFNWFLIQRAVNRTTGQVVTTGRCPVFCINGVGYKYWKFIVREEDVLHPTTGPSNSQYQLLDPPSTSGTGLTVKSTPYRTPADYHTIDNFAILNTTNQISLTEDSKYLLGFLNNLTTPRFRYSDELDMIGQTSADVIGHGMELSINAYNQTLPRTYCGLPANNKYNTGLRICVLKDIPPA